MTVGLGASGEKATLMAPNMGSVIPKNWSTSGGTVGKPLTSSTPLNHSVMRLVVDDSSEPAAEVVVVVSVVALLLVLVLTLSAVIVCNLTAMVIGDKRMPELGASAKHTRRVAMPE